MEVKEMSDKTISIIVPMYKGKKYISNILYMYDENVRTLRKAKNFDSVELIMINDYPDEKFVVKHQGVRVIDNEENKGIHKSRVIGLNYCRGDYVLMLDQDDYISPNFLLSQIQNIGSSDLVVCNGKHNDWPIFESDDDFRNKMDDVGVNYIVSPGQVLIKSSSIPKEWKEDLMRCAGADDYYLWILMTSKGAEFAYNNQILFKHIKNGFNSSNNMRLMNASNQELLQKIDTHIKDNTYKDRLLAGIHSTIEENNMQLQIEKVFEIIATDKKFIQNLLEINECNKISVYGFGSMGQKTYDLLKKNGIAVTCVWDKKIPSQYMSNEYNIKVPSRENLELVDNNELILVTPIKPCDEIKTFLRQSGVKHITSLIDLAKDNV